MDFRIHLSRPLPPLKDYVENWQFLLNDHGSQTQKFRHLSEESSEKWQKNMNNVRCCQNKLSINQNLYISLGIWAGELFNLHQHAVPMCLALSSKFRALGFLLSEILPPQPKHFCYSSHYIPSFLLCVFICSY